MRTTSKAGVKLEKLPDRTTINGKQSLMEYTDDLP
jgi:hypothetical protein